MFPPDHRPDPAAAPSLTSLLVHTSPQIEMGQFDMRILPSIFEANFLKVRKLIPVIKQEVSKKMQISAPFGIRGLAMLFFPLQISNIILVNTPVRCEFCFGECS